MLALSAQGASAPREFVLRHGSGRLVLPTSHPFQSAGGVEWQDHCGKGARICAGAEISSEKLYLIGGTISPEEARGTFECEPGARKESKTGACIRKQDGIFTWTRRFKNIVIAVSSDSTRLDTDLLARWLSAIRWEEK
jgi:hypothetical protein